MPEVRAQSPGAPATVVRVPAESLAGAGAGEEALPKAERPSTVTAGGDAGVARDIPALETGAVPQGGCQSASVGVSSSAAARAKKRKVQECSDNAAMTTRAATASVALGDTLLDRIGRSAVVWPAKTHAVPRKKTPPAHQQTGLNACATLQRIRERKRVNEKENLVVFERLKYDSISRMSHTHARRMHHRCCSYFSQDYSVQTWYVVCK